MSKKTTLKPIAAAVGTTFAVSLATLPIANAAENPFAMTELSNGGYMVAGEHGAEAKDAMDKKDAMGKKGKEGKCGEGKCGEGKKGKEGKCGEGKCGEGKKGKEGKCGEGKCGG